MNFKVGDWVRVPKHKHIFQFTSTFEEDGIEYIADGYDDIYGQQGWTIDEVELWEPQVGEWIVRKFTGNKAIIMQYTTEERIIGKNPIVEPFIGTLPSFLKDN